MFNSLATAATTHPVYAYAPPAWMLVSMAVIVSVALVVIAVALVSISLPVRRKH